MTPEEIKEYEALLAAGTENARYQRMMEMQKAQAEAMRGAGGPAQGQMVSGHYVAPSWTQHLSSLANSYMSAKKSQQAEESGSAFDKSQGMQNSMVLKALLKNRMSGMQPPQTAPVANQAPMDNPYEST